MIRFLLAAAVLAGTVAALTYHGFTRVTPPSPTTSPRRPHPRR